MMEIKLSKNITPMDEAVKYLSYLAAQDVDPSQIQRAVDGDDRSVIKQWLEGYQRSLIHGTEGDDGDDGSGIPTPEYLPMRFVAFRGVPRKKTLLHTVMTRDQHGNPVSTPGIMLEFRKNTTDPSVMVLDVKEMPETRRPNNRIDPAEISRRIMATDEWARGHDPNNVNMRGGIIAYDEYQELRDMQAQQAKEMDEQRKQFQQNMASKLSKRGAPTV